MESKKNEIEERIFDDLQQAIWDYYEKENISYKSKQSALDTIERFLMYQNKLIPICKRNVFYSKELVTKISNHKLKEEQVKILEEYKKAFENGRNMNGFLSNNIKKSQEIDFLLSVWHLYHLHMSGKFVQNKEQMKNNRSDIQLLCIINPTDVYFIDVIPHPKKSRDYFDCSHLKIIINNKWERFIDLYPLENVVRGTIKFTISSPEDIYQLYAKSSVNMPFEFEGKMYIFLKGITAARTPFEITERLRNIKKTIKAIANELETQDDFYNGIDLIYDDTQIPTFSVLLKSRTIKLF